MRVANTGAGRWTRACLFTVVCSAAVAIVAVPAAAGTRQRAHEVPYAELLTGGDVEVFMADDASDEEIARVRAAIRDTNAVSRFTLIDDAVTRREFQRTFADQPRLRRAALRAEIPVSFRVVFAESSDFKRWMARIKKMAGVQAVDDTREFGSADVIGSVEACVAMDSTNELFMKIDASQAQIDAVRQVLAQEPGISRVRFVTKDQAYADLLEIFARNQELVDSISADDLPTSFRFTIDPKAATPVDTDALQALPGVDAVTDRTRLCERFGIKLPAR